MENYKTIVPIHTNVKMIVTITKDLNKNPNVSANIYKGKKLIEAYKFKHIEYVKAIAASIWIFRKADTLIAKAQRDVLVTAFSNVILTDYVEKYGVD